MSRVTSILDVCMQLLKKLDASIGAKHQFLDDISLVMINNFFLFFYMMLCTFVFYGGYVLRILFGI